MRWPRSSAIKRLPAAAIDTPASAVIPPAGPAHLVVPMNPDAAVMRPVSRDPNVTTTVVPIGRAARVIRTVADFNAETLRVRHRGDEHSAGEQQEN